MARLKYPQEARTHRRASFNVGDAMQCHLPGIPPHGRFHRQPRDRAGCQSTPAERRADVPQPRGQCALGRDGRRCHTLPHHVVIEPRCAGQHGATDLSLRRCGVAAGRHIFCPIRLSKPVTAWRRTIGFPLAEPCRGRMHQDGVVAEHQPRCIMRRLSEDPHGGEVIFGPFCYPRTIQDPVEIDRGAPSSSMSGSRFSLGQ